MFRQLITFFGSMFHREVKPLPKLLQPPPPTAIPGYSYASPRSSTLSEQQLRARRKVRMNIQYESRRRNRA